MRFVTSCLLAAILLSPSGSRAQVNYLARFEMPKRGFLLGEPVFCVYTIRNTGTGTFAFRYRTPSRELNPDLEQEPRFRVTDAAGRQPPDPAPRPCGGAKGSVVYGSVTLPPGETHTEHWLLNQWARFSAPGQYRLRAERRLPLLALDPARQSFSEKPVAYALAIDELQFEIAPASEAQLQSAFRPYLAALNDKKISNPAEAVLVLTTLPQPFFLPELEAMASAPSPDRWDRRQALEGLARLGAPAAWQAILKIAQHGTTAVPPRGDKAGAAKEDSLRAYAVLLLAEKEDEAYLPALIELASNAPEGFRGDILRALGFFHDLRAYQTLFENLHAASPTDRMNAILGLKNLGNKDSIPALLAMFNDADPQVRQIANFALEGLTGQPISLSPAASREETARVARQWHAWWQEEGANFNPARPPACQDW